MRNVPPDKYNVAWFKLAECVSRGEKERALGVYRLLAHSLNDSAFARQLQGDILLSFNDLAGAVEHYRKAAQDYQNDGRYLESAALYEHIMILAADKQESLTQLIELYRLLGMPGKMLVHGQSLCLLLLSNSAYSQALLLLDQLQDLLPVATTQDLCQQVIVALARSGYELTPAVARQLERLVTSLIHEAEPAKLQRFMGALETTQEAYYLHACSLM